MRIWDHYIRDCHEHRKRLRNPLQGLVLQQVPPDRLVVREVIYQGVLAYLANHSHERHELVPDISMESLRGAVEEVLDQLVWLKFVRRIYGSDIKRKLYF